MRELQFHLFEERKVRRKTVSKKLIIITAAAGLASFAGAFFLGWRTEPPSVSGPEESGQPTPAAVETVPELPQPGVGVIGAVGTATDREKKAMTEKQLKNLVFEVREKMQEYNDKLQSLEVWEKRLQRAQDTLKEDIKNLNDLRVELTLIVTGLKDERDKLLKSRLEVAQAEKDNLVLIAATYDKMDASSASKILISMCASQTQPDKVDSQGSGFDEAVKILYYMTERTKAKLLAEVTTAEPKLAAFLTRRLKKVVEGN
jgi:flagellar motility protein MotE (MotC chaperone)